MTENVTDELVEETLIETEQALDEPAQIADETVIEQGTDAGQDYVPSYSYKVLDEEREFDTRFHGIVKSKDDEEFLRDLYTRADGLDSYKQKLSTADTEFDNYKQQMTPVVDGFQKLRTARDEGNLQDLFYDLGVQDDAILNYALDLAKERELPEQQQVAVQQNRDYQRQVADLETRVSSYETGVQQERIATQVNELNTMIASDDVQDIVGALPDRDKSLQSAVYNYGVGVFQSTGREPTVKEAFDAVINQYRGLMPRVDADKLDTQTKTLPRVKGDGGVNQAQKVLTLDDLKKMAEAIPN